MTAIPVTASTTSTPTFSMTSAQEEKIAAFSLFDERFARSTIDYLKPEYFPNVLDRNLVSLTQGFVRKYGSLPEPTTMVGLVTGHAAIRTPVEQQMHIKRYMELCRVDRSKEREHSLDLVNDFCKKQHLLLLAASIPDLLAKDRYEKIEDQFRIFQNIGEERGEQFIDYFDQAQVRREQREAIATGIIVPGVSTGFDEIDDRLYRKGYQRRALTCIMAPSKRGKTAFMLQSAIYSTLRGNNGLYISLEVSDDILGDRADACLTGTQMMSLIHDRDQVAVDVDAIGKQPHAGKLWFETRPSASFTTQQVENLIENYFNTGRPLDFVVVDYIGILRIKPADDRYLGLGNAAKHLRASAGRFNLAMITGAQTNRDAINKEVSGMGSIGDSFAIVQDVDLLLSINASEEEIAQGVRRIHWAASRNEQECTLKVHGDLEKMQLIQKVLGTVGF